jgi:hypothetical protein
MQQDIDWTVSQMESTGNYSRDEFGFFQPNASQRMPILSEIQTPSGPQILNWSASKFCLNCREYGHVFTACQKMPFSDLLEEITREFGRKQSVPPEAFDQFFRDVWG